MFRFSNSMLSRAIFVTATFLVVVMFDQTNAQFGISKGDAGQRNSPEAVADGNANSDLMNDLMDDPELAEAMKMFSQMSPDEMKDLMGELVEILGDDPSTIEAMQDVMAELGTMKPGDFEAVVEGMLNDRKVSQAVDETLLQLAEADEEMLETILQRADVILESVIESGHLTEEEATKFRSDPEAWKQELLAIWTDVQNQANNVDGSTGTGTGGDGDGGNEEL